MSWPVVKFRDIAKVVTGATPKKKDELYDGEVPFVTPGDLGLVSSISNASRTLTQEGADSIRPVPTGSVMVCCIGATIGKVGIAEKTVATNQQINSLIIDESKAFPKYVFYFCLTLKHKLMAASSSTTMPIVNKTSFSEFEIPLPPLAEQKRIAAILDKADAIRQKRKQAIDLADEFLRSVFLDMFGDPVTNTKGWEVHALGKLCEDLFLGLTSKVDYVDDDSGYPLVRAKDINTGELKFDDVKFISESQHKKLTKNHLTKKGDLLVSKSGTLGTCAIVRTDREFSTYESIFTVRPIDGLLNVNYLIHLLQNNSFKAKLIGNKVGGTVAHLNLKMFRDFELGVPTFSQQEAFSKKIEKVEMKLSRYRESLKKSEYLFNSLSQKAFSGEL
ncbi:restriction endonuclease subunit S [Vibrio splendidus]